jgi:CMP-N-acetylneuraminic acid synthetase
MEKDCYAYLMNRLYSTDVDDFEDFQMAEAIVQYMPEFKDYFNR